MNSLIAMERKIIFIYLIWLVLVIGWNFGYPSATPLQDVLAAGILACLVLLQVEIVSSMNYLLFFSSSIFFTKPLRSRTISEKGSGECFK